MAMPACWIRSSRLIGRRAVFTILLFLFCSSPGSAVTVSIDAVTSGFMIGAGNSDHIVGSTIQNYQAGYNKTTDETAKNWFVFDIPTLLPGEVIIGAAISLYLPTFPPDAGFGYGSGDPSETFTLFTLDAAQLAVIDAPTILGDLATGADFDAWFPMLGAGGDIAADGVVTKADEGSSIVLPFSPEAMTYLEGSVGSPVLFGGLVSSIDNPPAADIAEALFHHTHPGGIGGPSTPTPTLILELAFIPEPTSTLLLAIGLASLSSGLQGRGRAARV